VGDQSGSAARSAGAAVGRKVRGKNSTVFSACVVSEVKSHAISIALGAWVWNLKTDKKKEEPTIFVASKDSQVVNDAASIAQAICRTRDLIHTPANIKTPAWMGQQAEEFAKGTGLKVEIFAGAALKEFGGLQSRWWFISKAWSTHDSSFIPTKIKKEICKSVATYCFGRQGNYL